MSLDRRLHRSRGAGARGQRRAAERAPARARRSCAAPQRAASDARAGARQFSVHHRPRASRARSAAAQVAVGNAALMRELGVEHAALARARRGAAARGADRRLRRRRRPAGGPARRRRSDQGERAPRRSARCMPEGLRIVMLTGDSRTTAEAVARKLGIDEVHADVLPDDKVAGRQAPAARRPRRRDGRRRHQRRAGAGAADVGIAMGTGTDVAMESAASRSSRATCAGIVRARRLSRQTMTNIRQNLFFAFVYNALGVPIAAGVLYPFFGFLLSPMLAAAAMSFSSVSVIANALRLRRVKIFGHRDLGVSSRRTWRRRKARVCSCSGARTGRLEVLLGHPGGPFWRRVTTARGASRRAASSGRGPARDARSANSPKRRASCRPARFFALGADHAAQRQDRARLGVRRRLRPRRVSSITDDHRMAAAIRPDHRDSRDRPRRVLLTRRRPPRDQRRRRRNCSTGSRPNAGCASSADSRRVSPRGCAAGAPDPARPCAGPRGRPAPCRPRRRPGT